jgi:hypothetical protein
MYLGGENDAFRQYERDSVTRFSTSGFFCISLPQAHEYTIEFFQTFAEIFAAQGAPPVSLKSVANEKIFFFFFFYYLQSENF